eukprot:7298330-Prymnesium_polylepis.1
MAEARYSRRMKRLHSGSSPFDPAKVPAFNVAAAKLPSFPDKDEQGRSIRCVSLQSSCHIGSADSLSAPGHLFYPLSPFAIFEWQ